MCQTFRVFEGRQTLAIAKEGVGIKLSLEVKGIVSGNEAIISHFEQSKLIEQLQAERG